jgi:hypothetical protein
MTRLTFGSQNWSAPGVSTNRDASLIIFNAEAAQYWETVFLHDWASMAVQQVAPPRGAAPGALRSLSPTSGDNPVHNRSL